MSAVEEDVFTDSVARIRSSREGKADAALMLLPFFSAWAGFHRKSSVQSWGNSSSKAIERGSA